MPDIRTLLHEAAPRPATAIDPGAIEQRARRRRLRRVLAWLAAGAVATGVGLPVGTGVLVTSNPGPTEAIHDPDPPGVDAARPPAAAAADGPASRSTKSPAAAAPDPPGALVGSGRPATDLPASVTVTTRPASGPSASAPAASCTVDNTGLAPGERRTCSFTATAAGGWRFSDGAGAGSQTNSATVTVSRRGQITTYRSSGFQSCGDAIIVPGDVVTVELTQALQTVAVLAYAAAGEGWSCTQRK